MSIHRSVYPPFSRGWRIYIFMLQMILMLRTAVIMMKTVHMSRRKGMGQRDMNLTLRTAAPLHPPPSVSLSSPTADPIPLTFLRLM